MEQPSLCRGSDSTREHQQDRDRGPSVAADRGWRDVHGSSRRGASATRSSVRHERDVRSSSAIEVALPSVDFWAFVDELGYDFVAPGPIHPDHVWSTERYLERLETLQTAKDTAPGTTFEYSNTNFDLLVMAIEHATGEPMAKVLRGDMLARPGLERMIWQTEEHPSAPVAAPLSRRWQADVTAAHEAGADTSLRPSTRGTRSSRIHHPSLGGCTTCSGVGY